MNIKRHQCNACGKLHIKYLECPYPPLSSYPPRLKQDVTTYNRIHKRMLRTHQKSGVCFYCEGEKKTQWSSIDHKYSSDFRDWQEVCAKCHYAYDATFFERNNAQDKPKGKHLVRLRTYAWYKD